MYMYIYIYIYIDHRFFVFLKAVKRLGEKCGLAAG